MRNKLQQTLKRLFFVWAAVLSFVLLNNTDVQASPYYDNVTEPSGEAVYSPDSSNSEQDDYGFLYEINNPDVTSSNEANIAIITSYNNRSDKYITIPKTVKIKYNDKTYTLRVVSIGDGINPFEMALFNNITPTTLVVPCTDWEITIGAHAFEGNSYIKNLRVLRTASVSTKLSSIGDYAFANSKMTHIYTYYSDTSTTASDYKLSTACDYIGKYAFFHTNITALEVGASSKTHFCTIGDYAFAECSELTTFTMMKNVEAIGAHAFQNCTSLTQALIPMRVKELKEFTYAGCTALTTCVVGSDTWVDSYSYGGDPAPIFRGLYSIGDYAFYGDSSLKNVGFYARYYDSGSRKHMRKTIYGKLNGNIQHVGDYAFMGCSKLKALTLPQVSPELVTDVYTPSDDDDIEPVGPIDEGDDSGDNSNPGDVPADGVDDFYDEEETSFALKRSNIGVGAFDPYTIVRYNEVRVQDYDKIIDIDPIAGDLSVEVKKEDAIAGKTTSKTKTLLSGYTCKAGDTITMYSKIKCCQHTTCSFTATFTNTTDGTERTVTFYCAGQVKYSKESVLNADGTLNYLISDTHYPLSKYQANYMQYVIPSDGDYTVKATVNVEHCTVGNNHIDLNINKLYIGLNDYTIHYDGNGAESGSVGEQQKIEDSPIYILPNGFIRPGFQFTGWNTKADGSGTAYAPNDVYDENANLTLYAQWVEMPKVIVNIQNGTAAIDGVPITSGKVYEFLKGTSHVLTFKPDDTYFLNSFAQDEVPFDLQSFSIPSESSYTFTCTEDTAFDIDYEHVRIDLKVINGKASIQSAYDNVDVGSADTAGTYTGYMYAPYGVTINGEHRPVVELSNSKNYHLEYISVDGTKVKLNPSYYKNLPLISLKKDISVEVCYFYDTDTQTLCNKSVYAYGSDKNIDGCFVTTDDLLQYEIEITNGTGADRTYVIHDLIPEGTTFKFKDDAAVLSSDESALDWEISIPSLSSNTITFGVEVNDSSAGMTIENSATVIEKALPGSYETDITRTTNKVTNPVLIPEIKKAYDDKGRDIEGSFVNVGDLITYEISIENPSVKSAIFSVTDVLPNGLTPKEISDDGTADGQTVTWELTLEPKTSKVISVTVEVTNTAPNVIKNIAYMNAVDIYSIEIPSPPSIVYLMNDPVKNVWSVPLPGESVVDLDGMIVDTDDLLRYELSYENPADESVNMTITDIVPEGTRIALLSDLNNPNDNPVGDYVISDDGTYDALTKTVTWNLVVDANTSGSVYFVVKPLDEAKGYIVNNAASFNVWTDPSVITPLTTNTVTTAVQGDSYKTAKDKDGNDVTNDIVSNGDYIYYDISFDNPANKDAEYTITDEVPDGVTLLNSGDYSISGNGIYDSSTNTITWTETLAPGESSSVGFWVKVSDDTLDCGILNQAHVYVDNAHVKSRYLTDSDAPTPIYILGDPKKAVMNVDGDNIDGVVKQVGDTLTFDITFKNPSDKRKSAKIIDKLSEYVTFKETLSHKSYEEGSGYTTDDETESYTFDEATNTVTWDLSVAPNSQKTISIIVKVNDSAKGNVIENSACVKIGYATKYTNTVYVPVLDTPEKDVYDENEVNINLMPVTVGQLLTYKISWENPADDAKLATIVDKLPTGVDFVSADNNGVYDEVLHVVKWSDIETLAKAGNEVSVHVRVNKSAASSTLSNSATVGMDEANISTEPVDGTVKNYVSTKTVYDNSRKNLDGKVAKAGETVNYDISFKNISNQIQTFIVKDKLPEGLKYASSTFNGSYDESTRVITWSLSVDPSAEEVLSVSTTVDDIAENTTAVNSADITIKSDSSSYTMTTNTVSTDLTTTPVKMVFDSQSNEITDKPVAVGDVITYKIYYENPSSEEQLVDVKDKLPGGVKFLNATLDGTYKENSHTVSWEGIVLEGNGTLSLAITVEVSESARNTTLSNTAVLDLDRVTLESHSKTPGSSPDKPKPSPNGPTDNFVSEKRVYLKDGKDVTSGYVFVGNELRYDITYKNTSDSTQKFTIVDKVPSQMNVVSASDNANIEGNTVTWNFDVPANTGGVVSINIVVDDTAAGNVIENIADLTIVTDSYSYTKHLSAEVTVLDRVVKHVVDSNNTAFEDKIVVSGDELTYVITVNNATDKAIKYHVEDMLPSGLKLISASDNGSYDEIARVVSWDTEFAPGTTDLIIKAEVTSDCDEKVTNTAFVQVNDSTYNTNKVTNYYMDKVTKSVVVNGKNADGKDIKNGDVAEFSISYANPTDESQSIKIVDELDSKFGSKISNISDNGQISGNSLVWELDNVAAGTSGTVTFKIEMPKFDTDTSIANKATVVIGDNVPQTFTTNIVTVNVKKYVKPTTQKETPKTPTVDVTKPSIEKLLPVAQKATPIPLKCFPDQVKTGDSTMWFILFFMSLIGGSVLTLYFYKKRVKTK